MATYAIGDLQGSFTSLQKLLDQINFDTRRDRLWFVGDLVNRGRESVQCLRFVRDLGEAAITVLGNHDLHLVCVAEGLARKRRSDTIEDVLNALDRAALIGWLRSRPLLHRQDEFVLVHAGLLPGWSAAQAAQLAREVELALQSENYREFLAAMYGNQPDAWHDDLTGFDRLRVIVNAMTRMRICTTDGAMEFSHKGEAQGFPDGYQPWFDIPGRQCADHTVIFGHWSALGLKMTENLLAIDTGCLWGRELTAVRLEDRQLFQVSCAELAGQGGWD